MPDEQNLTFATTNQLIDELFSRFDTVAFGGVKQLKETPDGTVESRKFRYQGSTLMIMGMLHRLQGEVFASDVRRDMPSDRRDEDE